MPRPFSTGNDRRRFAIPLYAVLLGAAVRLVFVLRAGFPLNDGGLFYVMVRDLQTAGFRLPAYTTYNGANIPFAYPPLALYAAGLLDRFAGMDLTTVFLILPLAANLLSILAFCQLARKIAPSAIASTAAVFVFAVLPRSSLWMIMGGGLTRSAGYLFALLFLDQLIQVYTARQDRHVIAAIVFASATALTHLGIAWFAAFSGALLWAFYGRNRAGVIRSLLVFFGALTVTAPWWITVAGRHGMATFIAAAAPGWSRLNGLLGVLLTGGTFEFAAPLLSMLALLGLIVSLRNRQPFLGWWLLAVCVLDPRNAHAVLPVPLALLAGIGVEQGLLPIFGEPGSQRDAGAGANAPARRPLAIAVLSLGLIYTASATVLANATVLTPLAESERDAMRWVQTHTPDGSSFLVVSADALGYDRTAEWFPALAHRTSMATFQGYEWVRGKAFARRLEMAETLRLCATQDAACLEQWMQDSQTDADYVYVPKRPAVTGPKWTSNQNDCCQALSGSLASEPRYELVYENSGAAIFRRN